MVARSKGCCTCVRRKVKCDERRPTCKRCENGSLNCEGYVREHKFIDEVERTVRHAQMTSSKSPSANSSRDLNSLSSNRQLLRTRDLSLVGFQDSATISFLLANIFAGMDPNTDPWMKRQAEDTTSVTAQSSLLALSKVYFGRMHHHQGIVKQGFVTYGQALKNLNKDLQDEEKAWTLSTLMSAMTLGIYEFVAFSSKAGWLQHAGGVGLLIQHRGPFRHQSVPERQLLEGSKVLIALECLVKRKRCFLESLEWKTIPWALEPQSKTPAMYTHDILCSIPGLMEDATALQNPGLTSEEFIELHQTLSKNIENYLAALYTWRARWEKANPHACYETPHPPLPDGEEPVFPTILHYPSITTANEITTYNAILLLLYRLGFEVIGSSFAPNSPSLCPSIPDPSLNPLYLPGHAPSPQAIAREICRSAEYHLFERHKSAGAFFLLFPLRVAHQVFEDGHREKKRLEGFMKRVADISGWEIGRDIYGDAAVGR